MLQHVFNHSPYEAIDFTYPGEFKRWKFGSFSRHNWNRSLAADAVLDAKSRLQKNCINLSPTYRGFYIF